MGANSACQEAKEAPAHCFFATDMTNRRKAEGALQASEDRHRRLLQQMPGFVAVLAGPNHVYEYVNDAYVAISGPRRFIGRSVREVFPELSGQGFHELLDRVYASGEPFSARAMPIRLTGDNEDRYIDLLYQPIRNDKGEVTGIFVGGYDTTERLRGEAFRDALVRLTDHLNDLSDPDAIEFTAAEILGKTLNASRVGYGTIDPVAETLHVRRDWNAPGVETLAGTVPLREYGSFIDSLKRGGFISIDDVDLDERTAAAADALKGRSAYSFVNVPVIEQGELVAVQYVNHGAVRKWSAEELTFIREVASRTRTAVERSRNDSALRHLNATLQERIEMALRAQAVTQEALRQSQKMDALGQLTGGLAHDFNNLLSAIIGSLELVQRRVAPDPRVQPLISNALQAAERGATLTKRMLAFARRQELHAEPTDIGLLITSMADLLERSLGSGIGVTIRHAPGIKPVMADRNQLEMAVLNLAVNARDAMPRGGPLILEAREEELSGENALGLPPGRYAVLAMIDCGSGMDEATLGRAIEPFYTTKGAGKGTGLGLSMVHGLAEQLHGRLQLESTPGRGTTASLWIPVTLEATRPANALAEERPAMPDPQSLDILAVDDDELVLTNTTAMLEDRGHRVSRAHSAREALDLLRRRPFDLLVTDHGMPGMTGAELIAVVQKNFPGTAIVLATGYAELLPGMAVDVPRVNKPFMQDDLLRAIRAAMEQKGPSTAK